MTKFTRCGLPKKEQIKIFKRYSENIFILPDGEQARNEARAIPIDRRILEDVGAVPEVLRQMATFNMDREGRVEAVNKKRFRLS